MTKLAIIASIGLVLTGPVAANTPSAPPEVTIPYAGNGGIRDWEGEGDKSILLRDRYDRWYRVTFLGTCPKVAYSSHLVFKTDASGTLDRFSTIVSERGSCAVGSIVRAEAPKSKGGK